VPRCELTLTQVLVLGPLYRHSKFPWTTFQVRQTILKAAEFRGEWYGLIMPRGMKRRQVDGA